MKDQQPLLGSYNFSPSVTNFTKIDFESRFSILLG